MKDTEAILLNRFTNYDPTLKLVICAIINCPNLTNIDHNDHKNDLCFFHVSKLVAIAAWLADAFLGCSGCQQWNQNISMTEYKSKKIKLILLSKFSEYYII